MSYHVQTITQQFLLAGVVVSGSKSLAKIQVDNVHLSSHINKAGYFGIDRNQRAHSLKNSQHLIASLSSMKAYHGIPLSRALSELKFAILKPQKI